MSVNVLVVDDSLVNLKVLGSVLENFGIEAKSASSGKECLEILKNEEFDLILLDHLMPEMDGIELLSALREAEVESPVVMISGHGNIETAVDCIKRGAADFIENNQTVFRGIF